jgi:hypothetical protein
LDFFGELVEAFSASIMLGDESWIAMYVSAVVFFTCQVSQHYDERSPTNR